MAIRSTGIRPIERNGLRGFGLTITIENTEQREVMDPVAVEAATEKQAAGTSRPTLFNSPGTPLAKANSAGEAPSSSQASPARHSDDGIPAFIKQDKPDCLKLKDGHCRLSFATSALCAECNQRRAMARALV